MCEFSGHSKTQSIASAWRSARVFDLLLSELHPTPRIFEPPNDELKHVTSDGRVGGLVRASGSTLRVGFRQLIKPRWRPMRPGDVRP